MATPTDITTGIQTVTAAGAVTPTTGLDISGLSGDFTLAIEVSGLTSGATARIQLEDTTNAFTNSNPLCVWDISGQVVDGSKSIKNTYRKYQVPNNLVGTASAKLRANVTVLSGTSPSLSLHAWIEQ